MKVPPENILQRMSPIDRAKHFPGTAGMTEQECGEKYAAGQEKRLQDDIAGWFDTQGIYYIRSRMDRKTTTRRGTPDFIVCINIAGLDLGALLAIECKSEGNTLTSEQVREMADIRASKGRVMVAFNLASVIGVVRQLQAELRQALEALLHDGWRKK